MLRSAMIVATLCLLSDCSSPAAAPTESVRSSGAKPSSTAAVSAASTNPSIVKLRLRDVDLTIVSSAEGPRFVLSAIDGAVLDANLGDAELAARYPDLYRLYRSALVRAKGVYLDARLDAPRELGSSRDVGPLPRLSPRR
jgi:hypothetical protein